MRKRPCSDRIIYVNIKDFTTSQAVCSFQTVGIMRQSPRNLGKGWLFEIVYFSRLFSKACDSLERSIHVHELK